MTGGDAIAVIGLGYVGLPLAVALSRHYSVTGFDVDLGRIAELRDGHDRTGELTDDVLAESRLELTTETAGIAAAGIYIVTVPTPVDADNRPDLALVESACRTIGGRLRPGNIVVFESTVYPGVTEEVCGPLLAETSGLVCGEDFFLGYSPERINPGDREHTIDRITKVVAGQTEAVAQRLAAMYGRITEGGVFLARDIKTAEAAKVIENAQRDINIAFVNEVAAICQRLSLSAHDVLEAARTKWNFLPFTPGLVGGHCIGVDPFYLAHRAIEMGHDPQIILAGRRLNDAMGDFIAERIAEQMAGPGRILVLGLTFKENVPDLRNTKVIDVVRGLEARGHRVTVHDPVADPAEAATLFDVELASTLTAAEGYDALVGAVCHDAYLALGADDLAGLVAAGGLVADIKGMWRGLALPEDRRRWQL
ncbi:MAG: nucleotide sugar dehydrogenase [Alphaproteobacteria bacterium]|nr:nucleotide sugar dehydrogenase [Alphaproteobacteria bacterium]MDP6815395.1 nucleotide sugar dehydrogenase [Alphaproteobacteria bacterium]